MQLRPRYDGPPILVFELPVGDPAVPLLRQRRRLGSTLHELDDEQWAAPSRCAGWSTQDVVAHLIGTNQYWAISFAAGLAGSPTRYLATFDPAATPAQMVDAMRTMTPAEVLAQYDETVEALAEVITGLDEPAWSTIAESPPGHVSMHAVARHALWDSWIHERDIAVPLGLECEREPDELRACLEYAAAIGPALLAAGGSTRTGVLATNATNPDVAFLVHTGASVIVRDGPIAIADAQLAGDAVELIEGLTYRAPLDHGLAPDDEWLLGALGEVFDVASST